MVNVALRCVSVSRSHVKIAPVTFVVATASVKAKVVAGLRTPIAEHILDRAHVAISEGIDLIKHVLHVGPVGAYQLQAAISAVHSEATT